MTMKTTKRVFKGLTTAIAAGALTLGSMSALSANWAELTDLQKRLPGHKFNMMQADNSGKVTKEIQFIADRQAILNHVSAYAYLIDEQRWDEWYQLFADDVVFESSVPCQGLLKAKGKKALQAITDLRYRGPGSNKNTKMRRHFQGNQHVAEQTENTAQVRTFMLIASTPENGKLRVATTGTYNMGMEKRDGQWTITRFAIEVDGRVRQSPMPESLPADLLEFKPHQCAE